MVNYYSRMLIFFTWILCLLCCTIEAKKSGPDPWNLDLINKSDKVKINEDITPDLKELPVIKVQTESSYGKGEWFYRRILALVLKGGQFKKNEDGSVDISLQMRIYETEWNALDELLRSKTPISEDMYRRSVGYIENAIYQPSIADKVIMAWGEYVQVYLTEYKSEITWTLALLAGACLLFLLWTRMSRRHFIEAMVVALYGYEVIISYKEAEKQDLDRFLTAIKSCNWYNIWSSNCEVPKPDPILFLKHMNPLKIGIRMFTTLITEPMLILSDTLKTLIHGMTDGLWFPLDKIIYGFLIITFNILLMFLLITILFNFIFNIPISLGYFGINLSLKQRNRTILSDSSNRNQQRISNEEQNREAPATRNNQNNEDRISGTNLQRVLDICAKALNTAHVNANSQNQRTTSSSNDVGLRRSSSTGRLPDTNSDMPTITDFRKRKSPLRHKGLGSGDANTDGKN